MCDAGSVICNPSTSAGYDDGVPRAVARGLEYEPQTGVPSAGLSRPPEAYVSPAEAHQDRRRFCRAHPVEHPHQVWAMDFQCDVTADG